MSARSTAEETTLAARDVAGGVRFELRVKPRSSKAAVVGVREGALVVAVKAPPVEGAANEEVRELLARALDVPRRDVEIIGGEHSKKKVVEVRGRAERELAKLLFGSAA